MQKIFSCQPLESDGSQFTAAASSSDHFADRLLTSDGALKGSTESILILSNKTVLSVAGSELHADSVVLTEGDSSDGRRTGDLHDKKGIKWLSTECLLSGASHSACCVYCSRLTVRCQVLLLCGLWIGSPLSLPDPCIIADRCGVSTL